mgnify:CR=1 FL=1
MKKLINLLYNIEINCQEKHLTTDVTNKSFEEIALEFINNANVLPLELSRDMPKKSFEWWECSVTVKLFQQAAVTNNKKATRIDE